MIEEEKRKNIIVSDLFVDIYKNFNVVPQVEKMNQLSKKELYLILTLSLDKFSDEDPVAKFNWMPFKDECIEIFNLQDDNDVNNICLKDLVNETGDKYIETDNIQSLDGSKMPNPLNKEDIRDAKINMISDLDDEERWSSMGSDELLQELEDLKNEKKQK